MSDSYNALFLQYIAMARIKSDTDLCALLSKSLEAFPVESRVKYLELAIRAGYPIETFAVSLGAKPNSDVKALKEYLDAKAKASAPEEVPVEETPAEKPDPMAKIPRKEQPAVVQSADGQKEEEKSVEQKSPARPEQGAPLVLPGASKILVPGVPASNTVPGPRSIPQPSVDKEESKEEGADEDGGDSKVSVPNPVASNTPRRPYAPQQKKESTGIKGWFKGRADAFNEWREGLGSGGSLSTKGSSFDFGDFLATKWQMLVMGVLALAVFGLVFFLGPASGGDDGSGGNSVLTFGSLQNVPFILFVIVIITFVLFLESNDRGDGVDAWLVIISVTLSSVAVKYKNQLTQVKIGDEPWGWAILGFLYFAPYLIIYIAVAVNRTRNIFASNMFKKLDFTPLYMCFLLFWSLAQVHKYWDFIPNPCLFPEGFYLGVGLIGLLLELSGNMVNLLVAVVGGVVSGLLIFNGNTTIYSVPNYVWVFVIYMLAMLYGFSDSATSQGTINMDSSKNEGGMSFGSTVKTKRFVPYDMYGGMVWLTAIVAIFYYGNPAFSLVSPF